MKNFMQQYPHIQVDFLFSHHLRQPFLRDTVDFIIDCKDHRLPDTEKIFLFREQYVVIGSPDYIAHHWVKTEQDLKRVNILSLDKDATWWKNFQVALSGTSCDLFKRITRINHVRGLINGAINGLGIGFVPKYTVIRELADKVLTDPFPHIRPAADHFNIFIKTKKLALTRNKTLIDHLTRIKPAEFGAMASSPVP
jgi:DNA-binding transcriptional LysR family regulator